MSFSGKVGDTLRLADTGRGHRYVILTKPNSDGNVVVVNFTSASYLKEWLVTFRPKDNKRLFIKQTTVDYSFARIVPVEKLGVEAKCNPNDYVFCPENLAEKIVTGAFQSQFTRIEVLTELSVQYPDEYRRYCV